MNTFNAFSDDSSNRRSRYEWILVVFFLASATFGVSLSEEVLSGGSPITAAVDLVASAVPSIDKLAAASAQPSSTRTFLALLWAVAPCVSLAYWWMTFLPLVQG